MKINKPASVNSGIKVTKAIEENKSKHKSSGKNKGGNFEREIAKKLSLWWTNNEREDIFYRSHSSGARFTSRKKAGKDTALQSGDITASDPIGAPLIEKWSIEIKTGYGNKNKDGSITRWDVLDLIDSKQKETVLQKMWSQCKKDAGNKEPILIFRRNGRSACIMFDLSFATIMALLDPDKYITVFLGDEIWRVYNLDYFLSCVKPEWFKE